MFIRLSQRKGKLHNTIEILVRLSVLPASTWLLDGWEWNWQKYQIILTFAPIRFRLTLAFFGRYTGKNQRNSIPGAKQHKKAEIIIIRNCASLKSESRLGNGNLLSVCDLCLNVVWYLEYLLPTNYNYHAHYAQIDVMHFFFAVVYKRIFEISGQENNNDFWNLRY